MGLLNELNTINRTLENNQKQLTKSEQRELDKIKKQKLMLYLKKNIAQLFEDVSNQNDVDVLVSLLIKNKDENIGFIKDEYFKQYQKELTASDINYLDEIYYTTVQKFNRNFTIIYKKDVEEEKQAEKERKEEERQKAIAERASQKEYIQRQKEKQIAYNNIIALLKTITLILASPFLLIGFVLIGIMKNMK